MQSVDSVAEEESSRQAEKNQELSGLAELVQAEIERAAEAQVVEVSNCTRPPQLIVGHTIVGGSQRQQSR